MINLLRKEDQKKILSTDLTKIKSLIENFRVIEERKLEKADRKAAEEAGIDMSKYILKSEIVPPVCPKCPDSRTCPMPKPCQPCPPCARCPEPSFECKKVPNYTRTNTMLPIPMLNDFSKF